jgi:hypothetical protein
VTSAALSNAVALAPDGYDPASVFLGGPLYRVRSGIRGQLKFRSKIAPPGAEHRDAGTQGGNQ